MDSETRFAVCVNNDGYPVSLDRMKLYTVLDDPDAEQDGMIRIVDESGEDYLYDTARFVVVNVPSIEANTLLQAMATPVATTAESGLRGLTSSSEQVRASTRKRDASYRSGITVACTTVSHQNLSQSLSW